MERDAERLAEEGVVGIVQKMQQIEEDMRSVEAALEEEGVVSDFFFLQGCFIQKKNLPLKISIPVRNL